MKLSEVKGSLMTCYICRQDHLITEHVEQYEICLNCKRKAERFAADYQLGEGLAIETLHQLNEQCTEQ